jgi:predicted RNA-binding Zn ribbon-like protein
MPPSRLPGHLRSDPDAEDLAIRFVNTAAWRLRDKAEERLTSPEALLAWLELNGIAAPAEIGRLSRVWKARPKAAKAAYDGAIDLREAIYALLTSQMRGEEPPSSALGFFNGFLSRPSAGLHIAWDAGRPVWRCRSIERGATDCLKPIALSAAELMTGIRAAKVRQCQDDRGCGWLFVDESRAQNRRWCSMGDCGNRAKAHRHYEKVRRRPCAT